MIKLKYVNKRVVSFLTAGVILVTSSGCSTCKKDSNHYEMHNNNDIVIDETFIPKAEEIIIPMIEKMSIPSIKDSVTYYNNYAYVVNDSVIYDHIINMNEVYYIDAYQKVLIDKTINDYALVEYFDEGSNSIKSGYMYFKDIELLPELFVEVDIGNQTVNMYKDNENILSSSVVTGKNSTPTRIGYFDIDYKESDTYLKGADYCSYVNYWMPFDGGIGLHDAGWRSVFGGEIYINDGSHGCVNLDYNTAREIYNNVSIGTRVLVHK